MIFRRWLLIYHEINFQYLSVHFQFSFSKDFLSDERNFYTHFHFYIITYILYCIGCRRINYWIYFNALGAGEKLPHTFLLHLVNEKKPPHFYCIGFMRKEMLTYRFVTSYLPSYFQIGKVSTRLFKFSSRYLNEGDLISPQKICPFDVKYNSFEKGARVYFSKLY